MKRKLCFPWHCNLCRIQLKSPPKILNMAFSLKLAFLALMYQTSRASWGNTVLSLRVKLIVCTIQRWAKHKHLNQIYDNTLMFSFKVDIREDHKPSISCALGWILLWVFTLLVFVRRCAVSNRRYCFSTFGKHGKLCARRILVARPVPSWECSGVFSKDWFVSFLGVFAWQSKQYNWRQLQAWEKLWAII